MGRTACTEPQCLYKGDLYLTVELYLYSPYGPYGLYRASMPVQGCTVPKCIALFIITTAFFPFLVILTFKNRASYIYDGRTPTLQMLHFIYFLSTNIGTEYFKHAAHSLFFSSKCRLFHNATFFGSCIIHNLHAV